MAKFVTLTLSNNERVLVNSKQISIISAHLDKDELTKVVAGGVSMLVKEWPNEITRMVALK